MTKLYNINIQGERSKAMRKLMMGIDIGTQSIRVALVDTDGNIIAIEDIHILLRHLNRIGQFRILHPGGIF